MTFTGPLRLMSCQSVKQVRLVSPVVSPFSLFTVTIWLFNMAMENPPIFKNGKPSISMGHLYHGYVSHNQMVSCSKCLGTGFCMTFVDWDGCSWVKKDEFFHAG